MSDEDFEPFVGGPPPDPSERTWRHPSEIAAQAHAEAMAELSSPNGGRRVIHGWRPSGTTNFLTLGSLGAAACLTALALFQITAGSNPGGSDPSETARAGLDAAVGATGLATTSTLVTPSTLTPSTLTPSTLTPSTLTPSTLTPSTLTPSTLTPSTLTSSTLPASLPVSPIVSTLVAAAVEDQLVGIAIGSDLTANGVLVNGYLITSASAVGNQLSVAYSHHDRRALAYLVGIDPFSDLAVFRPSAESRAGRTLESLATNVGGSTANISNPNISNPNISNPNISNPNISIAGISDIAEPGDAIISATLTDGGLQSATGIVLAIEHSGITSDGQPLIGLIDTNIRRPDNPGGILIDPAGNVVGIVVDTASSLASAIPLRDAVAIADRLTQQGWANETWIGFIGIDHDDGVEVIDVTIEGPAANADLRPGDVIRYLDGARIDHMGGVTAGLRQAAPGDTIVIVIERSGELIALRVEVSAYALDVGDADGELVGGAPDRDGEAASVSGSDDG